jgi:hypothetical protein
MPTIKVTKPKHLDNAFNHWNPLLNQVINRGTFAEDKVTAIQRTCTSVFVSFDKGEQIKFILK